MRLLWWGWRDYTGGRKGHPGALMGFNRISVGGTPRREDYYCRILQTDKINKAGAKTSMYTRKFLWIIVIHFVSSWLVVNH